MLILGDPKHNQSKEKRTGRTGRVDLKVQILTRAIIPASTNAVTSPVQTVNPMMRITIELVLSIRTWN
jgi:hypothetical protein